MKLYSNSEIKAMSCKTLKQIVLTLAATLKGRYKFCTQSLQWVLRQKLLKYDLRKRSEWERLYQYLYINARKALMIAINKEVAGITFQTDTLQGDDMLHLYPSSGSIIVRLICHTTRTGRIYMISKRCSYTAVWVKGSIHFVWSVPVNGNPHLSSTNHVCDSLKEAFNRCIATDYEINKLVADNKACLFA